MTYIHKKEIVHSAFYPGNKHGTLGNKYLNYPEIKPNDRTNMFRNLLLANLAKYYVTTTIGSLVSTGSLVKVRTIKSIEFY